jgi:hypothetical protein
MIIKYAVLNPINGEYDKVDTKEDAYLIIVKNVLDFYKTHCHSYPISEIQISENGDETWVSVDNGTELPQEYIEQIKNGISE